jgi:integrase
MVFRRKGSRFWSYKFRYNGAVIYESARTTNKRLAEEAERKRRHELERGLLGIRRPRETPLFKAAAREWLKSRTGLAEKSRKSYAHYVETLSAELGGKLVCDTRAEDIAELQRTREEQGFRGRRINYEIGVLQQILRKYGVWAHLADSVEKLGERHDIGQQIPPEEVERLLGAVKQSGSPALLPLVILSLDTGLRASEVRSLRHSDLALEWKDGVIVAGGLTVPNSKTPAGTGRYVPFTPRVCAVLTLWLARFPGAAAGSYLFPRHAVSLAGGMRPHVYDVDLTKPMGEWKTAWRRALKLAGLRYRWHDCRHTFVSRLCENPRVSEETIRSLAGHVSKRMLERYSHIRTEAKRAAIADLAATSAEWDGLQDVVQSTPQPTPLAH